jgi:hypothetical protein
MTDNLCSICLENLQNGKYLFILDDCFHMFHHDCINKYVVNKITINSLLCCPLCRSNFRSVGFQRIDLNLFKNSLDKNNIFNKLPSECLIFENLPISKKLAEFLCVPQNCLMNILSVTKRIYKYMNDNNLIIESRENSEKIFILDERLKYLFIENNIINSNELKYTDIQIYLSRHIGYFTES